MPDFNKGSTFNKDANFQGVKFGADAPLLETELNELQDIQTEARAEIIRDTIPSGFVQLGELDFDYMLNNENCVKMKTDSVAYVNGYKVVIPKDTIINIGKAPEKDAREDLLFLEVWKEEVTKDSVLTVAGGEGQAQINNPILDDRVGQETARRIALKWRIRHVADVDFEKHPRGLNERQSGGTRQDRIKISQNLLKFELGTNTDRDYMSQYSCSNDTTHDSNGRYSNDVGLFVAGNGDKYLVNTTDGWVYAIPMFSLYRKPSCGKSIPFEYQKINPKVDYSKFTDLMKEEKVERVVNETISGRSLVNLCTNGKNLSSSISYIDIRSLVQIKADTKYTVIFTLSDVVKGQYNVPINLSIENEARVGLATAPFSDGTHKCVITTRNIDSEYPLDINKPVYLYIWTHSNNSGQSFKTSNIIVLEGDWTDKEIPQYFTGLKSLGEDEGNLITVKNAILNESSYDPDTGTPKLNTVSGANYITSENLIMPTIEAQVKRGETKLSDLNAFGKVDNLVGDEVVDFTKIKGRTLQNLLKDGFKNWGMSVSGDNTITKENYKLIINKPDTSAQCTLVLSKTKVHLKPSTKYTAIAKISNNTLTSAFNLVHCYESIMLTKNACTVDVGFNGVYIGSFTTIADLSLGERLEINVGANRTGTVTIENFVILEGDYTTIPLDQLPFIEGIQSVGEQEVTEDGKYKVKLKSCGKNLFNGIFETGGISSTTGENVQSSTIKRTDFIKVKMPITFSRKEINGYMGFRYYDINKNFVNTFAFNGLSFTINEPNVEYIRFLNADGVTDLDYQLEEGTVATEYEPYKEYKQEITLKEPLRSLPNGVCDIIEGNKIIRRVRKIILDGSNDEFSWLTGMVDTTSELYYRVWGNFKMTTLYLPKNSSTTSLICDNFAFIGIDSVLQKYVGEGIGHTFYRAKNDRQIQFKILSSKLSKVSIDGFKTWLSQNPVTVYYELATPVEELIEPNYDKESIKTYQLDEPLRSLPNGVKDEIVGNKLIRRCGEIILNGSESWAQGVAQGGWNTTGNTLPFIAYLSVIKESSNNYCDKFLSMDTNSCVTKDIECIGQTSTGSNPYTAIRISKSRLSSSDVTGFKAWLKANPIKLIYELATPIEILLKEVLPSKVNFSLERQFKYSDNYLLELPNGVKDTVENGKVTRRVKKIVLNGSEDWADSSSLVLANTIGFRVIPSDKKVNTEIFCDKFKYVHHNSLTTLDEEFITGQGTTSQVYIRIAKSRLSSPDLTGFKAWLSANPITVLYELNTPTTEKLSGNNYMYCPSHEINTYCGSMYIGDGTNDVIVENGLKNEGVIIDTPFRSIADKEVVTDCKYKKSDDGYDMGIVAMYKNLINPEIAKYIDIGIRDIKGVSKNTLLAKPVKNTRELYIFKTKPNTNCTFSISEANESFQAFIGELNASGIGINNHLIWTHLNNNKSFTFTTSAECDSIVINCHSGYKIQLEEGATATPYEDFIPMEKAFENTEENDIEDLRHLTSLVGFNYEQMLNKSFDSLLRGEL